MISWYWAWSLYSILIQSGCCLIISCIQTDELLLNMIDNSTIFCAVNRNGGQCTSLVSICRKIYTRLSTIVDLRISSTRLNELIKVSNVECCPTHAYIRYVLELSTYVLHTFSAIVVKHRKCDVSVELRLLRQALVIVLPSPKLASRSASIN